MRARVRIASAVSPRAPVPVTAPARVLAHACRLLSQNTALALQQHALTHVAEHFCYKFATRRLLDPPPASLGQPHRALHAGVLRALFRLLAVSDHFVARSLRAEAREAVRCAACSALQPELLLEVAIEALARTLPGAAAPRRARASATSPPDSASDSRSADADEEVRPSDTSVALVEMGLLVVYLVLARCARARARARAVHAPSMSARDFAARTRTRARASAAAARAPTSEHLSLIHI